MANTTLGGDDNFIGVLTRSESSVFTAADIAAIDDVDRALEASVGRLQTRHAIAVARAATLPRRAPRWFRLLEAVHGAGVGPAPMLVDAGALALVLHHFVGRFWPWGVVAFLLAGLIGGLYRNRTPVESQGLGWYFRKSWSPGFTLLVTVAAGPPTLQTATNAAMFGGLLVLGIRLCIWLVIAGGRRRGLGLRPALLLGDPAGCQAVHRRVLAFPECGLHPVVWSDPATPGWDTSYIPKTSVEHVLVLPQNGHDHLVNQVVLESGDAGMAVSLVVPQARFLRQPSRPTIGDIALLPVGRPLVRRLASWKKRTFDILASAAGLVVCAPLIALTALAVWIDDRGPIFYRQRRVGRHGRLFGMWKFRSMVVGADRMVDELADVNVGSGLLFKVPHDPRVTRVGRILRRLSLDELPQLMNVLKGDMSLVGPRPLPVDPDDFDEVAHRRHVVRPGITGLWQVQGGNALTYDEMVSLDLAYIATWSLKADLEILFRTLPAILVRRTPC